MIVFNNWFLIFLNLIIVFYKLVEVVFSILWVYYYYVNSYLIFFYFDCGFRLIVWVSFGSSLVFILYFLS